MPAIRPAMPEDLPAVKAIYDAYVAGSIATFDTVPPPLAAWEEKVDSMYVAVDAQVVGFAYAGTYRPRPAYDGTVETTVYLAPGAAGRGVGRALYDALFERLDSEGVHTSIAVIALPNDEQAPVAAELREAGFEPISIGHPGELDALLASRRDVGVAIIDGETDFDASLEYYALLHEDGRDIPALMVVSPRTLEQLSTSETTTSADDEYFTRPYSTESLRWRVEARCIRSQTVDDGSGPIIQSGSIDSGDWARRATVVAVFNPKGGVGKTTVATNLAAALQVRKQHDALPI